MQEKWIKELEWRGGCEPDTLGTIHDELMHAAEVLDKGDLNDRERERYLRGYNLMKQLIERADAELQYKDDVKRRAELARRLQKLVHAEYILDGILMHKNDLSEDDTVPVLHPQVMEELWKQVEVINGAEYRQGE